MAPLKGQMSSILQSLPASRCCGWARVQILTVYLPYSYSIQKILGTEVAKHSKQSKKPKDPTLLNQSLRSSPHHSPESSKTGPPQDILFDPPKEASCIQYIQTYRQRGMLEDPIYLSIKTNRKSHSCMISPMLASKNPNSSHPTI